MCALTLSVCVHIDGISRQVPAHQVAASGYGNSNSLFVNQSVIDMCQYGFTLSAPTSKTTTSFTADPLTTPETTNTTESEKSEGATLDNISITVWVLLCCCILFVILVILLVFFSRHEQNMRSQSNGLSAREPEEFIVINNSVYGCNVKPPSDSGEDPCL